MPNDTIVVIYSLARIIRVSVSLGFKTFALSLKLKHTNSGNNLDKTKFRQQLSGEKCSALPKAYFLTVCDEKTK